MLRSQSRIGITDREHSVAIRAGASWKLAHHWADSPPSLPSTAPIFNNPVLASSCISLGALRVLRGLKILLLRNMEERVIREVVEQRLTIR